MPNPPTSSSHGHHSAPSAPAHQRNAGPSAPASDSYGGSVGPAAPRHSGGYGGSSPRIEAREYPAFEGQRPPSSMSRSYQSSDVGGGGYGFCRGAGFWGNTWFAPRRPFVAATAYPPSRGCPSFLGAGGAFAGMALLMLGVMAAAPLIALVGLIALVAAGGSALASGNDGPSQAAYVN